METIVNLKKSVMIYNPGIKPMINSSPRLQENEWNKVNKTHMPREFAIQSTVVTSRMVKGSAEHTPP